MKTLSIIKTICILIIMCVLCMFNFQEKGVCIAFLLDCLFFMILSFVSISDFKTMTIPDVYHILIFLLGVGSFFLNKPPLSSLLLGTFVISVPMFLLALFFGGFGGGDIKLCAASGFYLGASLIIVGSVLGTILAAFYASILLLYKKAKGTDSLCFGPFLSLGFSLATVFGPSILQSYFLLLS